MSLEESINTLVIEIRRLCSLIKSNNEIVEGTQFDIPATKPDPKPSNKSIRLLKEHEAAIYLGVSRSFSRQDRMNGYRKSRTRGPNPIKFGSSIRYDIEELDAWVISKKISFKWTWHCIFI